MKYFLSAVLLFLLNSNIYAQNSLNADLSVPYQVQKDKIFTEYIKINKPSNLHSYAVFTQQIPDGFFIETKKVSGADISFQNQILTIIWMRLPSGNSIKIPINIDYIKGITGTFSLSGKLTYLIDNKKGELKFKKHNFTIIPENNSVSKNLNKYGTIYNTFQDIKCVRKIKLQNDNSYLTELRINKLPSINNFILTEEVSQNFNISNIENYNASIIPKKRIIQLEIKNNKKSKDIILKYRLIPKNKDQKQQPVIFGKLSFIYDGQIITVPVENQP